MRSSGNGDKAVCVRNLLALVRGEVPYDRLRGLDARIVDRPAGEAASEAVQDAKWMLGTYEPRAVVDGVEFVQDGAEGGGFTVKANIS